jgi:hypothetical protein
MDKQRILKILIPFITLALMLILIEVVSKSAVNDSLLIRITSWGFFLCGFIAYWVLVKLGIN